VTESLYSTSVLTRLDTGDWPDNVELALKNVIRYTVLKKSESRVIMVNRVSAITIVFKLGV